MVEAYNIQLTSDAKVLLAKVRADEIVVLDRQNAEVIVNDKRQMHQETIQEERKKVDAALHNKVQKSLNSLQKKNDSKC